MKKSILTILTLLPIWCFGQKQDSVVFNGATKIIVKNERTAADNFKFSGNKLIDNNYFIGSKDMDFYQIISEPLVITGNAYHKALILYIVNKDKEIIITPRTRKVSTIKIIPGQENHPVNEPVVYDRGIELNRDAFKKALSFAKTLGTSVLFSE